MLLKLAWRNIWRNKRRSFITLAAIVFAAVMSIAMRGIQKGTYALNIKSAVELFSGYMQIQEKGYLDNPSLSLSFTVDKTIRNAINSTHGITGYSPRIYADGLISFKNNSRGIAIFGINPEKEKSVTTFIRNVNSGSAFNSDSSDKIVVGDLLLKNLGAKIGDTVIVLAQGYDGMLGNQKYIISGTVKLGITEMESAIIFMGIKSGQSLLSMGNRVNVVALKEDNLNNLEDIKSVLSANINNRQLSVLPWNKVNPEMEQAIQMDNISGIFFLGILIVIVAFGILNTVLMSVIERFREFGVMLAMGMPNINLVSVIYLETALLTITGLIIGNIIGFSVNYYLIVHPITFGGEAVKIYEMYHFLPQLKSSLQPSIFLNSSFAILLISAVSCFYPAFKLYKLEPLKGIRHT